MTFLLDANVLIALIDPSHIHHIPAHTWFQREGHFSWASSPLTQNAVLRIIGHPAYANSPGSPAMVAAVLGALLDHEGHEFWPDDLSLLNSARFDRQALLSHRQITDSYLLGLAAEHDAQLATFDLKLSTAAVHGGAKALRQITG